MDPNAAAPEGGSEGVKWVSVAYRGVKVPAAERQFAQQPAAIVVPPAPAEVPPAVVPPVVPPAVPPAEVPPTPAPAVVPPAPAVVPPAPASTEVPPAPAAVPPAPAGVPPALAGVPPALAPAAVPLAPTAVLPAPPAPIRSWPSAGRLAKDTMVPHANIIVHTPDGERMYRMPIAGVQETADRLAGGAAAEGLPARYFAVEAIQVPTWAPVPELGPELRLLYKILGMKFLTVAAKGGRVLVQRREAAATEAAVAALNAPGADATAALITHRIESLCFPEYFRGGAEGPETLLALAELLQVTYWALPGGVWVLADGPDLKATMGRLGYGPAP